MIISDQISACCCLLKCFLLKSMWCCFVVFLTCKHEEIAFPDEFILVYFSVYLVFHCGDIVKKKWQKWGFRKKITKKEGGVGHIGVPSIEEGGVQTFCTICTQWPDYRAGFSHKMVEVLEVRTITLFLKTSQEILSFITVKFIDLVNLTILRFFDVYRRYGKGALTWYGFKKQNTHLQ